MERIGVRELRQNASVYLRRVAAGERFTVTDRGAPVAELVPVSVDPLQRLMDEGLVVAPEEPFSAADVTPVRLPEGSPTAAQVLDEIRDEG